MILCQIADQEAGSPLIERTERDIENWHALSVIERDVANDPAELAPVSLDTTLSTRTEKEWPS
jgi:hypothetical protein